MDGRTDTFQRTQFQPVAWFSGSRGMQCIGPSHEEWSSLLFSCTVQRPIAQRTPSFPWEAGKWLGTNVTVIYTSAVWYWSRDAWVDAAAEIANDKRWKTLHSMHTAILSECLLVCPLGFVSKSGWPISFLNCFGRHLKNPIDGRQEEDFLPAGQCPSVFGRLGSHRNCFSWHSYTTRNIISTSVLAGRSFCCLSDLRFVLYGTVTLSNQW